MNYSYFDKISSKQCIPISVEQLVERMKQPDIQTVCEQILQNLDEGNDKEASRLKARLPVIVLGQLYEEGQPRSKNGGKPTGLLMIDYDDCKTKEEAQELMSHIKQKWLSDLYLQDIIVAAHFSPRMHGVHIWYRWIDGCHSYEECNERIAQLLERPDYDESCKDNSRCSFLVPYSYFRIENWDAMNNNEAFAQLQGAQEQPTASLPKARAYSQAQNNTTNNPDGTPPHRGGGREGVRFPTGGGREGVRFPTEYDGIAYSRIVKELTFKCCSGNVDADGNVREGLRNSTFFKVACLLRYICDNDADWLVSLAPEWAKALDDERPGELYTLCKSATERKLAFTYPRTLTNVLESFKKDENECAVESERQQARETRQKFCVDQMEGIEESKKKFLAFPKALPPIFQEYCDAVKPEWKAAVVLTLLPTLGTLMSKLRCKYLDRRMHSPSFQTVIEAKMGAGKQNMMDIADYILTPLTIKEMESNALINAYNQEAIKANNSKTLSDPPDVCARKMIGKFTEAGLDSYMNTAKGLHIWSGITEIDQVADIWKSLSYILRIAYDNGNYGRSLQSQKQYRGERPLFLNTFLCGTPVAINRVYNDPEDGLVSRTIFYKQIVETPDMPINDISPAKMKSIGMLCSKIHNRYTIDDNNIVVNEQVVSLPWLNQHMKKWLDAKHNDAVEFGSEAIERFRRRDALHGFRAGMVAYGIYLTMGKKITDKEKAIIKEFAGWVADYALMMHDYKFGKQMNEILAADEYAEVDHKVPVLSHLADVFTLTEAYEAFQGTKEASVRSMLSRLVASKKLEIIDRGVYSKVKK